MRFGFRSMAGLVLAASLSVASADAQASNEPGVEVYLPSAFEEFLPQNANDLVRRLPGFQVDEGDDVRGLSGAQGNVLINGRRPPPRSGSLDARLSSVRVEDVGRLELIEAGEMRKTDDDHLEDFVDVYDFQKAFDEEYEIDTTRAFSRN